MGRNYYFILQPLPQAEVKLETSSPTMSRAGTPNLGLEIDAVYSEKGSRREEEMPTLRPRRQQQLQQQHTQQQVQQQQSQQQYLQQQQSQFQSQLQQQLQAHQHQNEPELTDLERFGAYVVSKLRRSQRKQIIIAEKVIAEVLMRANLGTLDESTMLTDIKAPPSLL